MAGSLLGFLVELVGGMAVAAGVTVVVGVAVLSGSRGTWTVRGRVCFSSAVEARGIAEARGRGWMTEAACNFQKSSWKRNVGGDQYSA